MQGYMYMFEICFKYYNYPYTSGSHTPEHHRSGSRLSMKKTGALGKAVRSKLSSKLYNSMDGSKPKTSLKLLESHVSEDMDDKSPTSPSQPQASGSMGRMSASSSTSSAGGQMVDKSKKRSKLCALLWRKPSN